MLTRFTHTPIHRAPHSPVHGPYKRTSGGVWAPAALFAGAEPGAAYDFFAPSTLYQDSARTIPVSALNDPIGSASDISGNNNHASQGTNANRALYKANGAEFGDPKFLRTGNINFSGTDTITVVCSVRKTSDASSGTICMLGPDIATSPGVSLYGPTHAAPTFGAYSRGTSLSANNYSDASVAATINVVLTGEFDISSDLCRLLINNVQRANSLADQGTGNYPNEALTLGKYGGAGTAYFNGSIGRFIIIGRSLTTDERLAAQSWCAAPYGIIL